MHGCARWNGAFAPLDDDDSQGSDRAPAILEKQTGGILAQASRDTTQGTDIVVRLARCDVVSNLDGYQTHKQTPYC